MDRPYTAHAAVTMKQVYYISMPFLIFVFQGEVETEL